MSNYKDVRNEMHTYSRAPLANGQNWIDQATAPAGHNISYDKVRVEEIPSASKRDDLLTSENNVRNVKSEYSSILRFLDNQPLMPIAGTNNESFTISGVQSGIFIDPSDKPIKANVLSNGYEIKLFKNGQEVVRDEGWTFDTFNGILHFNHSIKDEDYADYTIEAFVYIGKTLKDLKQETMNSLSSVTQSSSLAKDLSVVIQPYDFSTNNMVRIGEVVPDAQAGRFYEVLSMVIPGCLIELVSLDSNESIATDKVITPEGNTQLFLCFPCTPSGVVINEYSNYGENDGGETAQTGPQRFRGFTLQTASHSTIKVNPIISFIESNPNDNVSQLEPTSDRPIYDDMSYNGEPTHIPPPPPRFSPWHF